MKIHEYQAKKILAEYGVPVPKGGVASTPEEAAAVAAHLGGKVVVKAQVHAGGRGKAGGIKLVASPKEAEQFARAILGKDLVTHQTGPKGVPVRKVLVAEGADIQRELYLAIVVDGGARGVVIIASEAGGVEIEEVAAKTPEKILRLKVDPTLGLQPFQGRKVAYFLKVKEEQVRQVAGLVASLYGAFMENDCTLAEINPLAVAPDGRIMAVDAKLSFEDDALFRHPALKELHDPEQEAAQEVQARNAGLNYVQLDGNIGCIVNGAGLAMATMDVAVAAGARPANFLDVGGGADEARVAEAVRILLSDSGVDAILVNIFGGILRCDVVARGILIGAESASRNLRPMVVRMLGTNAEEGRKLLSQSSLDVKLVNDLGEAAAAIKALG
ncbi:MAG: ADP-forming succinate--CoA ligase subunit beta [SAR202 cluster bacterium]|nr:ADP-forming succinate--CoA ligase subunit beta [SAR202 cluster bacterium]